MGCLMTSIINKLAIQSLRVRIQLPLEEGENSKKYETVAYTYLLASKALASYFSLFSPSASGSWIRALKLWITS
jgi:hypothetical protein